MITNDELLTVLNTIFFNESEILSLATERGGGDFPDCLEVARVIAERYDLPVCEGVFYAGRPGSDYCSDAWMPHAWSMLPDSLILDLTSDQFFGGAGPGLQVIRPGDPSHSRYWSTGSGMWETEPPSRKLSHLGSVSPAADAAASTESE